MTIDNFQQISTFLDFTCPSALYTVNIFQRRKDNPDLTKHSKLLKTYYIRSLDDLEKCKNSIIDICNEKNARAYIDLNARDIEKVALYALKKTADHIANKEYDAVKNVYLDACGNSPILYTKLWMIDIDTKCEDTLNVVKLRLPGSQCVPTQNGYHLVCFPFPFNKWDPIKDTEVIKHCVTLLYKN